MKKILKLGLVFMMIFTLVGCGSKGSDVGKILEEKGYTIVRREQFKNVQRCVGFVSSDRKTQIEASFKLDKSFLGISYGEGDNKYYHTSEEAAMGNQIDSSLKSNYENWLKDMGIKEDDLKNYLTELNNQTRKPTDLQSIVDKAKLDAELKTPSETRYDDELYLESKTMNVFMTAFIKNDKILTFSFADGTYGADKLFVYTNNKVFKNEGVGGYMMFLYELNITHEEFNNFLESVYANNKS